ncbi:DNA polymerase theta-like [Dreissena polymorpha]|uniref:DNA polymerase theta-like n=1 Tax=Dreissena polymorpha TaxID=45954 RepID=UPI002264A94A|nr:DNA polymerase theta-like [Dreissena polymorpha]
MSRISDHQPSFHDLSFASPVDISTPQIFRNNQCTTKENKDSPTDAKKAKNKNLSDSKKPRNERAAESAPLSTPRRSQRNSSKNNRKQILNTVTSPETALGTGRDTSVDKSDFFKSLCVDNESIDESKLERKKAEKSPKSEKLQHGSDIGQQEHQTLESSSLADDERSLFPRKRLGVNQAATSTIMPDVDQDSLALSSWGLPAVVLNQYAARGITHMFQWQAECLMLGNVLNGGNLVYSAPTSAGKTMVAELLVLKRVLETRRKAVIILPFVSVTREKMFYLQELFQDAGVRVGGFMGHYSPPGGFSGTDIAVCTIEKGNSLINRLLEDNKLDTLGIIVVDELHLIGDRSRGYLLELLLTKITYMCSRRQQGPDGTVTPPSIQIVGMSATLPNLDLLARWLHADLYRTDFRPVPLAECVKIGNQVFDSEMKPLREVDVKYAVKGDEDHVVPLCIETMRGGHSILIFCPTKNWCESLAEQVARELYRLLRDPSLAVHKQPEGGASDVLVLPLDPRTLLDTLEQLRRTPVGLDSVLARTVQYGVAYHHAGLTFDERDIIEGAFRQGILKVLVATSTLSSGVNLPARRVLIRTPVFHGGQMIDFLTYKQMIGRAGRKGVDTAGESILLCKAADRPKAEALVRGALPPVHSTLVRSEGESLSSSMKRAILEVVVSGVAGCPRDVETYASCTLLASSMAGEGTSLCGEGSGQGGTGNMIQESIQFLLDNEFVCMQKIADKNGEVTQRFVPTQLGCAVLSSSISPDEGLVVFSELQRARQCFVLENELHIIYQVTPIYAQIDTIDWLQYFSIWEGLSTGMKRVAELVGVTEAFLAKAIRGRIPNKTYEQLKTLAIHKRFYTCLVLHDLVQEMPLGAVCSKYGCNKGQLQSLQQSAATFAGMVTVFCARLGWSNLELILSQFQSRLTFGVQRELCDLVRMSSLNGQRARVLYNGGYQTVAALAGALPEDVEAILGNSAPFESKKKQATETDWEAEQRRKAHCIFLTGRKGVTCHEAAVIIINEAKQMIQEELGGVGVTWGQQLGKSPTVKTPVLMSPLAGNSKRSGHKGKASSSEKTKLSESCNNANSFMTNVISAPVLRVSSDTNVCSSVLSAETARTSGKTNQDENTARKAPSQNDRNECSKTVLNGTEGSVTNLKDQVKSNANKQNVEITSNTKTISVDDLVTIANNSNSKTINIACGMNVNNVNDANGCLESNLLRSQLGDAKMNDSVGAEQCKGDIVSECKGDIVSECKGDIVSECKGDIVSENIETDTNTDQDFSFSTALDNLTNDHNGRQINSDENCHLVSENAQKDIECVNSKDLISNDNDKIQLDGVLKIPAPNHSVKSVVTHNNTNKSGNINPKLSNDDNDHAFADSFAITTQMLNSCENVHIQTSNKSGSLVSKTENDKRVVAGQQSEALFSEVIPDDSFNAVEIDNIDNNNKMVLDQLSDTNNLKNVNSLLEVSNNDLEMNISHNSTEDMFNDSPGLIAASNYERVGLDNIQSSLDNEEMMTSFDDIHIPYQSGQERCFEQGDKETVGEKNKTVICAPLQEVKSDKSKPSHKRNNPLGQTAVGVLGQFSSQKPVGPLQGQEILHEDLAMALAMGESFSSTFDITTHDTQTGANVKAAVQEQHDQLGDSFTVSMMDYVVANNEEIPYKNVFKNEKITSKNVANNEEITYKNLGKAADTTMACTSEGWPQVGLKVTDDAVCSPQGIDSEKFVTPTNRPRKRRSVSSIKSSRLPKQQKLDDSDLETSPSTVSVRNLPKRLHTLKKVTQVISSKPDSKSRRALNSTKPVTLNKEEQNQPLTALSSPKRDTNGSLNTSTEGDYVPPTPPDDTPPTAMETRGTPTKPEVPRPFPASPFSPRLRRNAPRSAKTTANVHQSDNLKHIEKNGKLFQEPDEKSSTKGVLSNCILEKGKNKKSSQNNNSVNVTSVPKEVSLPSDDHKHSKCSAIPYKNPIEGHITSKSEDENNIEYGENDCYIDDDDEKMSPSFIDPNMSGLPLTQQSFTIIDVCGDKRLFKTFIIEWRTKHSYAVSLACETLKRDNTGPSIGANFRKDKSPSRVKGGDACGIPLEGEGLCIVGVAVSWDNRDAYYISLSHQQLQQGDPDDSLAPPPSDRDISMAIRVKAIKSVLQQAVCQSQPVTIMMFDVKTQYRALVEGCGFSPRGQFADPKVACWLLDPGGREKNLHRMVTNFLPTEVHMIHGIGGGIGLGSLGMSPQNPGSGRYRATTEAVLVRHLVQYFNACLDREGLLSAFRDVEMPAAVTLCRMELNGFGFSETESERQKCVMLSKLSALEEQAYTIAGHPFSLSAPDDVSQVLFIELRLPPNGDPSSVQKPLGAPGRRGGGGTSRTQYSTSKEVLERLRKLHPLPGVILEWRRITNALTKTVFPLQRVKVPCDWLHMDRIYGDCQLHSATGRVSLSEPNLQNVPKDFDIQLPDLIGESPPPCVSAGPRERQSRLRSLRDQGQRSAVTKDNSGGTFSVSMRHAFVPFKDGVLLAADYSQLELRMIAYLSHDKRLISVLNEDGDVFKLITAQWKNITPADVTPEQRAQAKQVCYGMIYGIGPKALGEQMGVEENDAGVFIETFKAKYPEMRAYLRKTVDQCRRQGYVQTMTGRKRYLPAITSPNPHARAQAERQAVNTTVQGSAADLVKRAMVSIDKSLEEMFPNTQYTHRHKLASKHPSRGKVPPDGAYLVLQLHDELIYEVTSAHVQAVAQVVKHCMEHAVELPVRMPVKLQTGSSWGTLKELDV